MQNQTVEDIRKINFDSLVSAVGVSSVADAMGVSESYIRQLKGGHRPVSRKTVRRLETLFDKPELSMDRAVQSANNEVKAININYLESMVEDIADDPSKQNLSAIETIREALAAYKEETKNNPGISAVTETVGSTRPAAGLLPISESPSLLQPQEIAALAKKGPAGIYRAKYDSSANEPRILKGSIVSIDSSKHATQGEMQAFVIDNQLVIGRYLDLQSGKSLMFTNAEHGILELDESAIDAGRVTHYTRTQTVS